MTPVLLLLHLLATACGAEVALQELRVFTGAGHARLLLVFSGAPGSVEGRSLSTEDGRPAHILIQLGGVGPGPEGDRTIPVDDAGIGALRLVTVGDDLDLIVELGEERALSTRFVGRSAVLVDLIEQGRGEDPALPSPAQLEAWLDGVGLSRPVANSRPRSRRLVVVDAGHGGWDHGAVGTTGTREADIALQIALRTAHSLRAAGVEVVLTRDSDVFVTLKDRAALANQRDADLFLSIHANAAPGPTAWGIETYSFDSASDGGAARVARRENAILREQRVEGETDPLLARMLVAGTNALSRRLSREVQAVVVQTLQQDYGADQIRDLGSKTALFYVLVSTRMPAILFESGFVSNPEDERRLRTPHYQQAVADALADAVQRWFESADSRSRALDAAGLGPKASPP